MWSDNTCKISRKLHSIAWSRSLNMFSYFKRDKDLLTHLNLRVLQQRKHLLVLGAYLDCLQLTSQTAKAVDKNANKQMNKQNAHNYAIITWRV